MRSNVEKERKCVILGLWAKSHKKGSKNHSFFIIFRSFSSKKALFEIPYQIKGNNPIKSSKGLVTKKRLKKWHFFTLFQKPVWAFCPIFCLRFPKKDPFLRWNLRRSFARSALKKHVFSSKTPNFTFAFFKCTLWINVSFWYFVRLKSSTPKNLRHFLR